MQRIYANKLNVSPNKFKKFNSSMREIVTRDRGVLKTMRRKHCGNFMEDRSDSSRSEDLYNMLHDTA